MNTNINNLPLRSLGVSRGAASPINSVQLFIRSIVWITSFLIIGGFFFIVSRAFQQIFSVFSILGFLMLIFDFYIASVVSKMFCVLPEWQSMVVLRLGKFHAVKKAGFFIIPPFIYSVASIIDNRIETQRVEATNTLTQDNVPTKITAAVEFKVEDPKKAVLDVQNYRRSVIWLATEALKNTIGSLTLKNLLSEREEIASSLKEQIDKGAIVYGVDVRAVRITDIDTPPNLVEELAVIARARRGAEAKKIQAEAEILVASKIAEASKMLNAQSGGMRLRELQTLNEISKEESSMVIIYPYGERVGQEIANSMAGRIQKNVLKPTPPAQEE